MRKRHLALLLLATLFPASAFSMEGIDNGLGKPCLINGKSCDELLKAAQLIRSKELEEEALLAFQMDMIEGALSGKDSLSPPQYVDRVKVLGPATLKKLSKNLQYQMAKHLQARGAQSHTYCLHPEKYMTGAIVVGQMLIAEKGDAVLEQAVSAVKSHANDAPVNWTLKYAISADTPFCKLSESKIEQQRLDDFAK